jgi:G:T-mismatch repair DNA endonuclease (very short patch repair protein)
MPAPKDPGRYETWHNKVVSVLRLNASKGGRAGKGKPKPWVSQRMRELWQDESYRKKISSLLKGKLAGDKNPSKRPEVREKIGHKMQKWWEELKSNPEFYWNYVQKVKDGLRRAKLEGKLNRKGNPKYQEAAIKKWKDPEYRKKQSEHIKGELNPAKRPEVRKKISLALVRNLMEGRYPKAITKFENKIASILEGAGIDFLRQFPVGNHVYDFAIPSRKLLINTNGCYWHGCNICFPDKALDSIQRRNKKYDYLRRKNAEMAGWKLIEIWEHELGKEEDIIGRILARLK